MQFILTGEPKVKSFVKDTAEKLGVSTRTIERHLWLAEHLTANTEKILKKMGKQQPSQNELMKLARLEPDQQEEAASLLASGAVKSIGQYHTEINFVRKYSKLSVLMKNPFFRACHSDAFKVKRSKSKTSLQNNLNITNVYTEN